MKSAQSFNPEGQYYVGYMIEHGMIKEVSPSRRVVEAVDWYQKAARQGNSEALTDLGFLYEKQIIGEGGEGLDLALDNYKKAVELSNPRAMNNFAGMFLAGNTYNNKLII